MRHNFWLAAAAAFCTVPSVAYAHGGLSLGDDHGNPLVWLYLFVLVAIAGIIVFRIYLRSTRPEGNHRISGRLADLEVALSSHLTKLRNADEYPADCDLSAKEKRTLLEDVASIRRLIEEEEQRLASALEDPQSAMTCRRGAARPICLI